MSEQIFSVLVSFIIVFFIYFVIDLRLRYYECNVENSTEFDMFYYLANQCLSISIACVIMLSIPLLSRFLLLLVPLTIFLLFYLFRAYIIAFKEIFKEIYKKTKVLEKIFTTIIVGVNFLITLVIVAIAIEFWGIRLFGFLCLKNIHAKVMIGGSLLNLVFFLSLTVVYRPASIVSEAIKGKCHSKNQNKKKNSENEGNNQK